jgi:ribosomal protein S18 acetylase RimI-like enzyme
VSGVSIRLATPEDADEIARLHVATSLAAYRPILGEEYSEGELQERIEVWRRMLLGDYSLAMMPPEKTYVATTPDDRIAGFCAVGPSRDEDADGIGEVFLLYVAPDHWGRGISERLFEAGTVYLRERGFVTMTLWVLEGNDRARGFYAKKGWAPDGARKPSYRNPSLAQVRYRTPTPARRD